MNHLLSFRLRLQQLCILSVLVILLSACSSNSLFEGSDNIGNCRLSGSVSYDNSTKTYTLTGAGVNMWNVSDEFFMVWRKVSGDFSLSAKIAFEGKGVNMHRKMGLIIRESLEGDAAYADVAVHGDGLTSLQYRSQKGNNTEELVSGNRAPSHIVLERSGNKIIMKTASGEFSKQADKELFIDLPQECYVGLFICSHDENVLETGYFSEVSFEKK